MSEVDGDPPDSGAPTPGARITNNEHETKRDAKTQLGNAITSA